ncbi:hypothetical protein Ahy_A03g016329 [Arachis hypogaea]|uniref:Uncharacterized protein n=1 Tax=Arachis hypogaea TaxID=3818 RepID=A0A445E2Y9_ARAHY|nr:hypothetical protein Ahy_A03g016329 [Arachis hypogaea]
MENQSSSSFSSLMEMQFLILDQVRFLDVNEDTLSQWELVDLFDVEEEWEEQCDNAISNRHSSVEVVVRDYEYSPFREWEDD